MIHSRVLLFLAIGLTTTACSHTVSPSLPLQDELAEKTPEKQQEILSDSCLNEAEKMNGRQSMWKHTEHGTVLIKDPKVNQSKALCRQMVDAYLSSDLEQHAALAQQCKEQILPAMHSENLTIVTHAHKMQEVCEVLTGQEIDLPEGD